MNINVDFAAAAGDKGFPRSLGTFFLNPCFMLSHSSDFPPFFFALIWSLWLRLYGT